MTSGDAERRAEKLESHPDGSRRNRREEGLGASRVTARREDSGPETEQLMEAMVERANMKLALARVEQNKGAAGVDKMTVEQLRAYLREHWLRIKEELLADDYRPQPVLRLIRRYLQAGMMSNGLTTARREGTPQGGPLSPLLSNILLDELDKELERRGHKFCRYADDCNIYVQSRSSGERVMKSITSFLDRRLRLQVNAEKSAVARPWERKFLGYSLTSNREPRLKVAKESVKRLKGKLREIFRRGRGRNLGKLIADELTPLLRGWINYFRLAEVKGIFEELDSWIRRKLRCLIWRHWKRTFARAKGLMRRGLREVQAWESATNGRGPWWNAGASHMHAAFPKSYFDRCELLSLRDQRLRLQRTS